MKQMFAVAGMLGLLVSAPIRVLAGAWTPAQGSAYHKLSINYFTGDSMFGGTPPGLEEFTNLNLTYDGEYGLLDKGACGGQGHSCAGKNACKGKATSRPTPRKPA